MSAERLREAANALRDPVRCNRPPYEDALADWLEAEAKHAELLGLQSAALNFLISTSDGTEHDQRWRVSLGYNTIQQALTVADAILGGAS